MTRSPTPATRAELVEVMASVVRVAHNDGEARRQAEAILAAIEARGCVVAPISPVTAEMQRAFRHAFDDAQDNARRLWIPDGPSNLLELNLAVAIAHTPYRKETTK